MIRRIARRLNEWRQKRSMAFMLVAGFVAVTALAMLSTLGVIGTMMRARMFRSSDIDLGDRARVLQSIMQVRENSLARQATAIANLEGLTAALTANDAGQAKRILIPAVVAQSIDSAYVILPNHQVLFHLGDEMGNDDTIARIPLVENGFDLLPGTSPAQIQGTLWFCATAPHRNPGGQVDAVILVSREVDSDYMQSLSQIIGTQVAFTFEDLAINSFVPSAAELPLSHLRAAQHEIAEYTESQVAFHSMDIQSVPYRVVAFSIPMRNAGGLNGYLFQPMALLIDSMREAVGQVLGIGVVILLIGSFLAYLFAQTVTRPLHQLTRATEATALGDFAHPLNITRQDEVGQLAQTFETMRAELAKMLQTQQQWNADLEMRVRAKTAELQALVEQRDHLLRQMISAQEEERRRIARELHDETSQSLTALIATCGAMQTQVPPETQTRLGELRPLLVRTLQEINRIVLDLRPALLDDLGLVPALEWYAGKRLDNSPTQVDVSTWGNPVRLSSTVETVLFRIGQEAITNAAKYAQADHVSVSVAFENGDAPSQVTLTVQDDGRGFDSNAAQRNPDDGRLRLGLLGMKERAQLVNGQLQIHSVVGEGTTIIATVPLPGQSVDEREGMA